MNDPYNPYIYSHPTPHGPAHAYGSNPYRPPAQHPPAVHPGNETSVLLDEPRAVRVRDAVGWITRGAESFSPQAGRWIGVLFIMFVVQLGMNLLPVLGGLASTLAPTFFLGGLMVGCQAIQTRQSLRYEHLYAGLEKHFVPLFWLGLIHMGWVVVMVFATAFAGLIVLFGGIGGVAMLMRALQEGAFSDIPPPTFHFDSIFIAAIVIGSITWIALVYVVEMTFALAPALVVLHDFAASDALKMSLRGGIKNFFPLCLFALMVVPLALLCAMPLFLGFLLLVPVLIGSTFAMYRDMFIADPSSPR